MEYEYKGLLCVPKQTPEVKALKEQKRRIKELEDKVKRLEEKLVLSGVIENDSQY